VLSGDELTGASKLYSYFLEALEGEINIARNVVGLEDFERAGKKVGEAADKAHYFQYEEAISLLSEAMSSITTSGQRAAEVLKERGLL
jgi:cobyrinic acid a,c-diamide synthase